MDARRNQTETRRPDPPATAAVRPVAPEDIRAGDYLVILRESTEYPAVLWLCDALPAEADGVLRIALLPEGGGVPRRVEAIYLPYLMAKLPCATLETLDVRRQHLARVERDSARIVWRARRRAHKARK